MGDSNRNIPMLIREWTQVNRGRMTDMLMTMSIPLTIQVKIIATDLMSSRHGRERAGGSLFCSLVISTRLRLLRIG